MKINHILLIEDDAVDAKFQIHSIKNAIENVRITHCETLAAGLEELELPDFFFDVVLSDLNLPDSPAAKTVKAILKKSPDTPLIVLSGDANQSSAKKAVSEGAQDYIFKDRFGNTDLKQKIVYAIERQRLVNTLNLAMKKINDQTNFKTRFLAHMSHEIRTPLNSIIGNTSILMDSSLSDGQRVMVESISNSGEDLLSIINDILDVSKMESGEIAVKPERFNIRDLVEDLIQSVAPLAGAKDLLVTNIIAASVPRFGYADPKRVKQVVLNLISNAIKYSEKGCISVAVDFDGDMLKTTVKDTGRGIPQARQKFLFQPYKQIMHEDQFMGTGLGLSISSHLVELLGGEIGFESVEGEGSSFWFTVQCPGESGAYVDRPNLLEKKILVFANKNMCNEILKEQLVNRGMTPVFAYDVDELMERCVASAPELIVFCGYSIEKEDLEIASKELNSNPSMKKTPVLKLVRHGELPDGPDHLNCLSLPFAQSRLYEMIACLISGEVDATGLQSNCKKNLSSRLLQSGKVLIVDDVAANVMVAQRMLGMLGCTYEVAVNGSDAILAAKVEKFDVILMDCKMPGLSGFEATKAIKNSMNPNTKTPIIALTANAMEEDKEKCIQSGMDEFMSKPIKIDQLRELLSRLLEPKLEKTRLSNNDPSIVGTKDLHRTESILDKEVLNMLKTMDEPGEQSPFLNDLINIYKQTTPEILSGLVSSMEENNMEEIEHYSHKLKGVSANLGIKTVVTLCDDIEQRCKSLSKEERMSLPKLVIAAHQLGVRELEENWFVQSA